MWMAAVLACGPTAVLSHRSAAALWGIGRERSAAIDLSVPAGVLRRRPGIRVHRRGPLAAELLTRHHRIPVTSPVLTIVDLALVLGRDRLEAAINEADKLDLTDPEALRADLEALGGHPGVAALRKTLDRRTFRATDTWLERRFLAIVRRARLALPETRRSQNGARVDFYWPELGLVVETDGLRYHRTPAQQSKDRKRDQRHAAAGLVPLRFTHEQVRYEPAEVQATLEAVIARLRAVPSG
jgi:very-short-patch-repair endonuclease